MLAYLNRLSKQKDFEAVFKNGGLQQNRYLALRFAPNGLAFCRLAVVTSARVDKKAVVRNKIRRRLMEILKPELTKIKAGQDIVLIVKNPIVVLGFQEINQQAKELFKRAKLYAG